MPTTNHHHHAIVNHRSPPKRNPKLPSLFLKLIIMFLILSIFLIFLGLAAILLLNLLLVGSFPNRRRRRDTADLPNNLPTFRYSAATTSDECSICLDVFKEGEFCRVLPVCGHFFHAQCVDSWLVKVLNCPVCRRPVRPDGDRRCESVISDDESKFLWAVGVGREVVW